MIQHFKLRNLGKDCINTILGNAFNLLGIKNCHKYVDKIHTQLQDFNRLYSWELSIDEYESHLIHIFHISLAITEMQNWLLDLCLG